MVQCHPLQEAVLHAIHAELIKVTQRDHRRDERGKCRMYALDGAIYLPDRTYDTDMRAREDQLTVVFE